MKKITTFFFLMACLSFCWQSSAQYLSEGFEGAFPPAGWTLNTTNAGYTWYASTVPYSGTYAAAVEYDPSLVAQDEDLLTPVIDLSGATAPQVSFWISSSYYWGVSPNDNYDITLSATDGATTTTIWTENDLGVFANYEYIQVVVDLTAYAGVNNLQLIFNYSGSDGAATYIDDILVQEAPIAPDCAIAPIMPSDGATDVPVGDLTLTWTAPPTGPTPTSYNLYEVDDLAGNNPVLIGNYPSTSADIPVNVFNTTIYWMVLPVNSTELASGCSVWSFTTEAFPGYCLSAVYGQYPGTAFTPATCNGTPENVTTCGYRSEYSLVNVVMGETYQFSSDQATDLVTIGDSTGAMAFDYGVGSVVWTSTIDGQVRFYTHLNDNACGESDDICITRSVACGPSLSIGEVSSENLFTYYPNPVSNTLTLNAQRNIQSVSVKNMLGQEVLRATPNTVNSVLDMSNLTSGSYFVNVTVEGVSETVRIIKE